MVAAAAAAVAAQACHDTNSPGSRASENDARESDAREPDVNQERSKARSTGVLTGQVVAHTTAGRVPVAGATVEVYYAGTPCIGKCAEGHAPAGSGGGPDGAAAGTPAYSALGKAATGVDGSFRIENLPNVRVDVLVGAPAGSPYSSELIRDVAIPAGGPGVLSVVLGSIN